MAKIFKARYPGICSKCDSRIETGDAITWTRTGGKRVYHATCPVNESGKNGTPGYQTPEQHQTPEQEYNYKGYDEPHDELPHDELPEPIEPEPIESPVKSEPVPNGTDPLAAMLARSIQSYLAPIESKAKLDEQAVRSLVQAEIGNALKGIATPVTVEVKNQQTGETKDMGIQHKQFPLLMSIIASGCNVWVTGPAGSGKTTAADNASKALGRKFYFCGAQSNEYGLLGFRNAQGETVRTAFREAYEHGGVFLFDEIDASAPPALLAFNAALANGVCAFPDGIVQRHADFVAIAAANTFGLGGTSDYVGRMKQDAAFIDRFVFLSWEHDEALETSTCGNAAWAKRVQAVRAKARAKGLKVIISPRASYFGAKLLAQGLDQKTVETLTLRKGMDDSQWESVR